MSACRPIHNNYHIHANKCSDNAMESNKTSVIMTVTGIKRMRIARICGVINWRLFVCNSAARKGRFQI